MCQQVLDKETALTAHEEQERKQLKYKRQSYPSHLGVESWANTGEGGESNSGECGKRGNQVTWSAKPQMQTDANGSLRAGSRAWAGLVLSILVLLKLTAVPPYLQFRCPLFQLPTVN